MDPIELRTGIMHAARRMQRVNLGMLLRGVTQGEYFALEMIRKASPADGKGIHVSSLAKKLTIASSAVSRMLHTLEEKKLVTREVDRSDRRNTRVRLTEEGERMRLEAAGRLNEFSVRAISRMGEEDTARLIELWNKMAGIMAEELDAMAKGERDA